VAEIGATSGGLVRPGSTPLADASSTIVGETTSRGRSIRPSMSQRWRLTLARGSAAAHLQHRDLTPRWEAIVADLAAAAGSDAAARGSDEPAGPPDEREAGRAKVVFAAPLPIGQTASAELVDLVLPIGRLPLARLRAMVVPRLPDGHVLVDAIDVWIGEPSLPSLVTGAAYTVDVAPPADASRSAVERAIAALLARGTLPRPGRDPARAATNLRPLIVRLTGEAHAEAPAVRLRMTLRMDPALGSGRPEEVVEALGLFGPALGIVHTHRDGFELREPPKRLPRLTLGGPRPTLKRRARTSPGDPMPNERAPVRPAP
jgi:hypothetical protein